MPPKSRRRGHVFLFVVCLATLVLTQVESSQDSCGSQGASSESIPLEEDDILAKESIRLLHGKIDDDADGDVDFSESDEFLRDELNYKDDFERHNTFHGKDKLISVEDLWMSWKSSEVYNWTVDEAVHWLITSVNLEQYAQAFTANSINGHSLPRLATNSGNFMSTVLGITDIRHRKKISFKATDVVLFGAPKPQHNYLKDFALVTSLLIAVGGCWFAVVQHRYSQTHVKKLIREMETLQSAEESLSQMQEKLVEAERTKESVVEEKLSLEAKLKSEIELAKREARKLHLARDNTDTEINRLRLCEEELEQVKTALVKAEKESEANQWQAPEALQQWLQLTHEYEVQQFKEKKIEAENRLLIAKEGCEKLRKKRSTFMGTLRLAHGSSLDEVDRKMLTAKEMLQDLTAILKERNHRWSQIENLVGFNIITNPGLKKLCALLPGPTKPNREQNTGPLLPNFFMSGSADDIPRLIGMVTSQSESHDLNSDLGIDDPPTYNCAVAGSSQAPSQPQERAGKPPPPVSQASIQSQESTTSSSSGSPPEFVIGDSPLDIPTANPITESIQLLQGQGSLPANGHREPSTLPRGHSQGANGSGSEAAAIARQRPPPTGLPLSQSMTSLEHHRDGSGSPPKPNKRKGWFKKQTEEEETHGSDGTDSIDGEERKKKKKNPLHFLANRSSDKNKVT